MITTTFKAEKTLTKDQILNLYVNQIYFGNNRYGIEEAALFYFGKHAREPTLGDCTIEPDPHFCSGAGRSAKDQVNESICKPGSW